MPLLTIPCNNTHLTDRIYIMPIHSPIQRRIKFSLETKLTVILALIILIPLIINNIVLLVYINNTFPQYQQITHNSILYLALGIGGLTLSFSFIASSIIAKYISVPLKALLQNLLHGNKDERLTNLKRSDEIGVLAQTVNDLSIFWEQSILKLSSNTQSLSDKINQFEIALSTVTDAVIAIDSNRCITVFNRSATHLLHISDQQALGKPISEIMKVYDKKDEISPLTYCPITEETSEEIGYHRERLRIVSNGNEAFVNIICRQVQEKEKSQIKAILILTDVTKEKRLEEMQLDFVSMAVHELRTPLTSIRGYLAVFMDENKDQFDGNQKMFLDRINISTQRLINLIENLLNVARVERGVFNINKQSVDWVTSAKQTIQELTFRAKDKNITLQFIDPPSPIPHIQADTLRINEVLTNLIVNAINYTPENGSITVTIDTNGKEVITHIKDTGVGIPKDKQDRLFTKFFRVSNTIDTGAKGTGLGLYISKQIIDLHHGHIWVESEVGKGSTFSFALPIIEEHI